MDIKCISLSEVSQADIIDLMNHPKVRQHMPLLEGDFNKANYDSFIAAKQKTWIDHGYGPWAFTLENKFIGWGGLQPADKDVEIALVLHPNFWGLGKALYHKIIHYAFNDKGFDSVIILFPPSRIRIKSILRLGFNPDGMVSFGGHPYIRYRLRRS